MRNIFVIGLDAFHRRILQRIRGSEDYRFHGLLDYEQVVNPEHYPIDALIDQGMARLDGFSGRIDAIIGHWDFPTTALLPLFRQHCGLPGPSLAAILIAEHKYWSRLRERSCIPEHIPAFTAVDPFAATVGVGLPYPFWLKPVIAYSSHLAFRIGDRAELDQALTQIRAGIGRFGTAFAAFLERAELPPDIPTAIDGYHCVAEQPIGGELCTAEGYVRDGRPHVYAVVDSYREGRHGSSFSRYQLPSRLPPPVQQRIAACTQRLIPALGLDTTPYNIEYFWDEARERLWLLEVNTRISKSHSPLFIDVTGASNHEVAVDIALGREPEFPRRQGRWPVAAKFMLRRHRDAVVTRVPSATELRELEQAFPGSFIELAVTAGQRLSTLPAQDAYSYEVATVFLGGTDSDDLLRRYQALIDRLPLEFDEHAAEGA